MAYLIVSTIATLLSVTAVMFARGLFYKRWGVDRSLFWKSGCLGIAVALIHSGVFLNLGSTFPGFEELPLAAQTVIFGIVTGLFFEIARYVALDRFFVKVRDQKSGMMFGLGWSGFMIALSGLLILIGAYFVYQLVHTGDVATLFPQATPDQLKQLQDTQKLVVQMAQQPGWYGIIMLVESVYMVLFDFLLTLLMIFGLKRGQSMYAWAAIILRTLVATSIYITATFNNQAYLLVPYAVVIVISVFGLKKLRHLFV